MSTHSPRRIGRGLIHKRPPRFTRFCIGNALAHEQKGVRGIYNNAEYLAQHREMLQRWADLVNAQIEEGRNVLLGRFGKALQVT